MRVIAEKVTDVSSKRTLLLSIERYEALAARSRTRASAKDKPHPA